MIFKKFIYLFFKYAELIKFRKCEDESDFSDTDDNASNFSEDMEDNSLHESTKNFEVVTQNGANPLSSSDIEIR